MKELSDRNGCIKYYASSIPDGIKWNRMVLGQEYFVGNFLLGRSLYQMKSKSLTELNSFIPITTKKKKTISSSTNNN